MAIHASQKLSRERPAGAAPRAIRLWLAAIALLVFAMIVVGGATRLTDSGLSITEWRPILGVIPPLNEADWAAAFAKYREIPEYKLVNKGMSLEAFKFIFWWEWSHRFLGRFIGFAVLVPLLVFLWRGVLSRALVLKLAGLFALGGLQGGIGWYMVQSGLVDRIDVSPYRLALHLTVAFVILAVTLWLYFSLAPPRNTARLSAGAAAVEWRARIALALAIAQTALGGLVAGAKAGLSHNTWPLMDGRIVPNGLWVMNPWYLNLFENVMTVQFFHRLTAYILVVFVVAHAVATARASDDEQARMTAIALAVGAVAQMGLGIWTLLARVPLSLGLLHQAGAAVVVGLAVWHCFHARAARQAG